MFDELDGSFKRQLAALYETEIAQQDFEREVPEQHNKLDELVARFKPGSLRRIDDIRSVIACKGHSSTDRASLILLIAICIVVEVGTKPNTGKKSVVDPHRSLSSENQSPISRKKLH